MGTVEADALVVVDMQRAFVEGADAIPGGTSVLTAVEHLLRSARAAGALVVNVQNDGPAGAVDAPGAPGWALATEPLPTEPIIRKQEDDAFAGTGLEGLLDRATASVVLCGVQSEMCVAATARAAMERGFTVVLPRDGHGTYPVPADADGGVEVPAAQVARVAEWSLGDALVVAGSSGQVAFRS